MWEGCMLLGRLYLAAAVHVKITWWCQLQLTPSCNASFLLDSWLRNNLQITCLSADCMWCARGRFLDCTTPIFRSGLCKFPKLISVALSLAFVLSVANFYMQQKFLNSFLRLPVYMYMCSVCVFLFAFFLYSNSPTSKSWRLSWTRRLRMSFWAFGPTSQRWVHVMSTQPA